MATLVFVIVWVGVALSVFFIALRGGPRGAREALHAQSGGGRHIAVTLIALVCIAGLAGPLAIILGNRDEAQAGEANVELTAAEEDGQELFATSCQNCHTLAAAHAVGKVGPNLDQLRPPAKLVLDAVLNGRVRGNGTMPAQLLQGEEAAHVAAFVAKVAGRNE